MARPTKLTAIGRRLRRAREDKGWKAAELARRSGVDASFISRVESGEIAAPSGERLGSLAAALGVPVDNLIHGKQEPSEAETDQLRQHLQARYGPDHADLIEAILNAADEKPARDRDVILRVARDMIATFPPVYPADRTT